MTTYQHLLTHCRRQRAKPLRWLLALLLLSLSGLFLCFQLNTVIPQSLGSFFGFVVLMLPIVGLSIVLMIAMSLVTVTSTLHEIVPNSVVHVMREDSETQACVKALLREDPRATHLTWDTLLRADPTTPPTLGCWLSRFQALCYLELPSPSSASDKAPD